MCLTKPSLSPGKFKSHCHPLTLLPELNYVIILSNGTCDVACHRGQASAVWLICPCVCVLMFQLNSPMNSVSSTEDIKPPLGINGVMKVPAQPSGTALSLTKHICAICGDRSSGEWWQVVASSLVKPCAKDNPEAKMYSYYFYLCTVTTF